MNSKPLVAVILLLGSGAAVADPEIATVQVRPGVQQYTVQISCDNPEGLSPLAVEQVLEINDRSQTSQLSHKLMVAAAEACSAGIATIVVSRSATGRSLTWAAAHEMPASVAAN